MDFINENWNAVVGIGLFFVFCFIVFGMLAFSTIRGTEVVEEPRRNISQAGNQDPYQAYGDQDYVPSEKVLDEQRESFRDGNYDKELDKWR